MEPRIVTKATFTVIGLKYHGKNAEGEISELWPRFLQRVGEIEHLIKPEIAYGVCGPMEEDGSFDYVAGFEVESAADIPAGMVKWAVPEQTYVVFPCTLEKIGETYSFISQSWLPDSDYEWGDGPDFELYDETFSPDDEGSGKLYIYVPVKTSESDY